MDCSAEEYRDQILEVFPKQVAMRVLETIAASAHQSPHVTHERVGH